MKNKFAFLLALLFLMSSNPISSIEKYDHITEKIIDIELKFSMIEAWVYGLFPELIKKKISCSISSFKHAPPFHYKSLLDKKINCLISKTIWVERMIQRNPHEKWDMLSKHVKKTYHLPSISRNKLYDLKSQLNSIHHVKNNKHLTSGQFDFVLFTPIFTDNNELIIQGRVNEKWSESKTQLKFHYIWSGIWPEEKPIWNFIRHHLYQTPKNSVLFKAINDYSNSEISYNYYSKLDLFFDNWLNKNPRVQYMNKGNINLLRTPNVTWYGNLFEITLRLETNDFRPIFRDEDDSYVFSIKNDLTLKICSADNKCALSPKKKVDSNFGI